MTFKEWLETEKGLGCSRMPVDSRDYLINRLWWAFQAGKESVEKTEPKVTTQPKDQ